MLLYSTPSSYYSMIARFALLESGIPFEVRYMDIHLAKEQLTPWYSVINPAMTVPTLVSGDHKWTSSQEILNFAATKAGEKWEDANQKTVAKIHDIVADHYAISIERLTFGKALVSIPPLRIVVPHMLRRLIRKLEATESSDINSTATNAKLAIEKGRLEFFTQGVLAHKLDEQRDSILYYLNKLPPAEKFLFGDKISSADIVTAVLLGRLKMIGEYGLVKKFPTLDDWFTRMQSLPTFKEADIWFRFKPWRILLKY